MKQYFEKIGVTDLDLKNETREITSFKLSTHLYENQQLSTPTTLNSLVAAVALACQADTIPVQDIITQTQKMFLYMKLKRSVFTFMTTLPA